MSMLIKVCLHDRIVFGILGTEGILLYTICNGPIIIDVIVTSLVFWLLRPCNKLAEVLALHDLIIANAVSRL